MRIRADEKRKPNVFVRDERLRTAFFPPFTPVTWVRIASGTPSFFPDRRPDCRQIATDFRGEAPARHGERELKVRIYRRYAIGSRCYRQDPASALHNEAPSYQWKSSEAALLRKMMSAD